MKKLLIYIICAVVVISCGLSIYYVVRNDENIYSTVENISKIYINEGETIDFPVKHENPNKNTELLIETTRDNVVQIDMENGTMTGLSADTISLNIIPTNAKFEPFEFTVMVGNGSQANPFFIRNEEDLRAIGSDKFSLSSNYEIVNDIHLTKEFSPIGSRQNHFTGSITGGFERFSINNLIINDENPNNSVGLFAVLGTDAKVENLKINSAQINAKSKFAGVVAGENLGLIGKIELNDCSVANLFESSDPEEYSYTGLVCGIMESVSSYAQISLVEGVGSITSNHISGGISGYNSGGIITNNNINIKKVEILKFAEYNCFGGVSGYSRDSVQKQGDIVVNNFQSIVMNNVVAVDKIDSLSQKIGGVFGRLASSSKENQGVYSMIFYTFPKEYPAVSYKDQVHDKTQDVINESTLQKGETANNFAKSISKEDLYDSENFNIVGSTFDIKNIWEFKTGSVLALNFEGENFEYQEIKMLGNVFEIDSNSTLKTAIEQMISQPSKNVTYLIKGEYSTSIDDFGIVTETGVYTYNAKDLKVIGTKDQPFRSSIISESGAKIKITNFEGSGEYAGLFGYVKGVNTRIENIVLQGAKIDGVVAGGIAGFNSQSTISNCTVLSAEITSTKYAGGIAGLNTGKIIDSTSDKCTIKVDEEKELNIYLGGIAGKNKNIIQNSQSLSNKTEISIEGKYNLVCIGGIAGSLQDAVIDSCVTSVFQVEGFRFHGSLYAGGIAGHLQNSKINYSGVIENEIKSSCLFNLNTKTSSLAGGIAGFVDRDSKIVKSSIGAGNFTANTLGGLVAYNDGEISECYVGEKVILNGVYAGGFASSLTGKIENSYTYAILNADEIQSGFVNFLFKDSLVKNCFTYCTYSLDAKGKSYADTSSNYKSRKDLFGSIENSAIICANDVEAKLGITDFFTTVIISRNSQTKATVQETFYFYENLLNKLNIFEERLLFGEDAFASFQKISFDGNIWAMKVESIGFSLSLNECFDSGYSQIDATVGDENTDGEGVEGENSQDKENAKDENEEDASESEITEN